MRHHTLDSKPTAIRLGENLRSRVTAYHVVSRHSCAPRAAYLDALEIFEGHRVEASHVWRGAGGLPYAYNVELFGKCYHVPALFAEPIAPDPITWEIVADEDIAIGRRGGFAAFHLDPVGRDSWRVWILGGGNRCNLDTVKGFEAACDRAERFPF
ncbi:hypothetical protein LCGC14_1352290 [marine sediment metagenome]|uniref:Uncharacterized protein n=1 Tax=marine sediment metagenome TaxID=412755 RepID=A0A0F9KWN1_9ZZZZ